MKMNEALTKRDFGILGAIFAVWLVLLFSAYRWPQHRILWWLFCASVVVTMIPRIVLILLTIWMMCQQIVARAVRRDT